MALSDYYKKKQSSGLASFARSQGAIEKPKGNITAFKGLDLAEKAGKDYATASKNYVPPVINTPKTTPIVTSTTKEPSSTLLGKTFEMPKVEYKKKESDVLKDQIKKSDILKDQIKERYGIDVEKRGKPFQVTQAIKEASLTNEQKKRLAKDLMEYETAKVESSSLKQAETSFVKGFSPVLTTDMETRYLDDATNYKQALQTPVSKVANVAGNLAKFAALYGIGGAAVAGKVIPTTGGVGAATGSLNTTLMQKLAYGAGSGTAGVMGGELIKDLTIGTGIGTSEALQRGERSDELAKTVAQNILINIGFNLGGALVGKAFRSIKEASDAAKMSKTVQMVDDLAAKANISPEEASKAIDAKIDFYVNQSGVADTKPFEQLQLPAPKSGLDDFTKWRKENFGGAFGNLSEADDIAMKQLYKESTGIDLIGKSKEVPKTVNLGEVSNQNIQKISPNAETISKQSLNMPRVSSIDTLTKTDTIGLPKIKSNVDEIRQATDTTKYAAEDIKPTSEKLTIELPKEDIKARIPQKDLGEFEKYRKTIHNSFMKSELPEETKIFFEENPQIYKQYTNQEAWDKAFLKVNDNLENAKKDFFTKPTLESADDTAEAIAIMHKLANENNIDELIKVSKNFAEKGTEAGRAIQAISMLQNTTPEGKLVQANTVVNNLVKKLKDETPGFYDDLIKKNKLPEITKEESQFIVDTMKRADGLKGRLKEIEIAKVDQMLADKIPVTFGDKFRALRNLSLLGNVKTIGVRNPLGNFVFSGIENVSQIPSGITDTMVSKILKTERQTKILPDIATQFKGAKKGVKETFEDILNNVDTSPTRGGAELPRNKKIFETAWLNKANNWLGNSLKLGDRPFYQAAYDMRLKELKSLQPNANIKDLEKLAQEFGLSRTFQNQGATADAIASIKRGMNKLNVKGVGLGDIVMPYTQTPANILAKGAEYTPLNILNIAKIAFGSGQGSVGKNIAKNQKSFTDAIGRMFTGTGIAALGYSLAKNGYVTGKTQDTSGKVKELKKGVGQQQYSVKIGDTWYSFDWAQPASIPLALGVDFYNAGLKEEDFLKQLSSGTISAGDTLFNQGVIQGVARMFGGQSPSEGVLEAIVNAPTQLLPTLGSQTAQTIDPYKRNVDYSSPFSQLKTSAMKRLPKVREQLPVALNIFGEPVKEQSGSTGVEKAIRTFVSPSLISKESSDKTLQETYRLFEATKDTDVIPSYTPSQLTSAEEKQNFKIVYGQMAKKALSEIYVSNIYKNATDEQRATLVRKKLSKLKDAAKQEYNKKYKTNLN